MPIILISGFLQVYLDSQRERLPLVDYLEYDDQHLSQFS